MAMRFTLQNILVAILSLYPPFIVTFLVVASLFNLKLNGLIYLSCIVCLFLICLLIANFFAKYFMTNRNGLGAICDFWNTFGYPYTVPSFQVAVTAFTCFYLIIPMIYNEQLNPVAVVLLPIMSLFNAIYLKLVGCTDIKGIIVGAIIGAGLGMGMAFGLLQSENKNLLFYNELVSNNAVCTRPQKKRFMCSIYKNGEQVSTAVV